MNPKFIYSEAIVYPVRLDEGIILLSIFLYACYEIINFYNLDVIVFAIIAIFVFIFIGCFTQLKLLQIDVDGEFIIFKNVYNKVIDKIELKDIKKVHRSTLKEAKDIAKQRKSPYSILIIGSKCFLQRGVLLTLANTTQVFFVTNSQDAIIELLDKIRKNKTVIISKSNETPKKDLDSAEYSYYEEKFYVIQKWSDYLVYQIFVIVFSGIGFVLVDFDEYSMNLLFFDLIFFFLIIQTLFILFFLYNKLIHKYTIIVSSSNLSIKNIFNQETENILIENIKTVELISGFNKYDLRKYRNVNFKAAYLRSIFNSGIMITLVNYQNIFINTNNSSKLNDILKYLIEKKNNKT